MDLVLGKINGNYLRFYTDNFSENTEEVLAAVAYATDEELLFNWCFDRSIPLKFYGRLDDDVAVTVPILEKFLRKSSSSSAYTCKLVQHHHAKVIWWRGVGVYIGSANLTNSAWIKNIEAGCFFSEDELDDKIVMELLDLFKVLEENSTPLTEELLKLMKDRSNQIRENSPSSEKFWNNPSIKKWPGLITVQSHDANTISRQNFLEEWYSTLQTLRDIGLRVSDKKWRPSWVDDQAATGAQADQFLHAHYYNHVLVSKRSTHNELYEKNKNRNEEALSDALEWWRDTTEAPTGEDVTLNEKVPYLRAALSERSLTSLDSAKFYEICKRVNAIWEYSRRVSNKTVGLPDNGSSYTMEDKLKALSRKIWNENTSDGKAVASVLNFILYEGNRDQLPERLWQSIFDPKWKIPGLGISSLGEIVGWALPDTFPPRNGRTSKALKSLGFPVTVH